MLQKRIKLYFYIRNGEYHLAADIWVINENNKILITQRHPDKNFGLLWECSGGAVVADESVVNWFVHMIRNK